MNPISFEKVLELAANVKDPVAALAFLTVLACWLFWVASRQRNKRNIGMLVLSGIMTLALGALPLLAGTYLKTHIGYEVRITVLGVDGSPVNDADIWCTPGGEQKRIGGGWECDVAPWNRPVDGVFTAFTAVKSAFLTGNGELRLGNDYHPVLQVQLVPQKLAELRAR